MNRVELLMRRRNVDAEIKADPAVVQFRRRSSVKTPAGGWVPSAPVTLAPQTVRILLNRRRWTNGIVNSEAGDIPHTDFLLLGRHNLNIEKEDEFTYLGEHYKVTGIFTAREESVLASLDLLGPENRHA